MIPYGKQDINNEDIESLVKVLKSDYLTQGPVVELFERDVQIASNIAKNKAASDTVTAVGQAGVDAYMLNNPV